MQKSLIVPFFRLWHFWRTPPISPVRAAMTQRCKWVRSQSTWYRSVWCLIRQPKHSNIWYIRLTSTICYWRRNVLLLAPSALCQELKYRKFCVIFCPPGQLLLRRERPQPLCWSRQHHHTNWLASGNNTRWLSYFISAFYYKYPDINICFLIMNLHSLSILKSHYL